MSKTISKLSYVLECNNACELGFADYKYDVCLVDGWVFTSGRMNQCQSARFNSVKEFFGACPKMVDTPGDTCDDR
jgi:hypothetical protein